MNSTARISRTVRLRAVGIGVLGLLALSSSTSASSVLKPTSFHAAQILETGSRPEAVIIDDFTGDGRDDVATSTGFKFDEENDFKLFLWVQNGNGNLVGPRKYETSLSYSSDAGLGSGDLNGDNKSDLALATLKGIEIFFQANGTLEPAVLISTPTDQSQVEVADFDGDTDLDMVSSGRSPTLFLNSGLGVFTQSILSGSAGSEIETGDVTGDGLIDIISLSQGVSVFENLGNGAFSLPVAYSVSGDSYGVAVGDFTGDGRQDVALSQGGNSPTSFVEVLAQTSMGNLGSGIRYPVADIPEPIEAGDMNGDGRTDIVTLHGGWFFAGTLLQRTDGSLAQECGQGIPYASHYNRKGLALGDLNHDGRTDIALGDYNHGLVVVRGKQPQGHLSLEKVNDYAEIGSELFFSGNLTFPPVCGDAGGPSGNQPISLFRTGSTGQTKEVDSTLTDSAGDFMFEDVVDEPGTYTYTAVWNGNTNWGKSTSEPVRSEVRKRTRTLTLRSSETVVYGQQVELVAKLGGFADTKNKKITIYEKPHGGSQTVLATGRMNSAGKLKVAASPGSRSLYTAEWSGDDHYLPASTSTSVGVQVIAKLSLKGSYGWFHRRQLFQEGTQPKVVARVDPAHPGEYLDLESQIKKGDKWIADSFGRVIIQDNGRAVTTFRAEDAGSRYRTRALFQGDVDHDPNSTPWKYFDITK